jgi:hypothetical protein
LLIELKKNEYSGFGHASRMDGTRIPTRILELKLKLKRTVDRCRRTVFSHQDETKELE